jgi:hypothetical protein
MEGMSMERRMKNLEAAFTPPEGVQLRALSEFAAEGTELDPALLAHEAEQVLARMRTAGPRSLDQVAAAEGIPAEELRALTADLRRQWQRTG